MASFCTGSFTMPSIDERPTVIPLLPHANFSAGSKLQNGCRWEWQPLANCTCTPSLGHLPAGASQAVLLTFQADKPVQLKGQALTLKATQISSSSEDGIRLWSSAGPSKPQTAEPSVQSVAGSTQDLQIKVRSCFPGSNRPFAEIMTCWRESEAWRRPEQPDCMVMEWRNASTEVWHRKLNNCMKCIHNIVHTGGQRIGCLTVIHVCCNEQVRIIPPCLVWANAAACFSKE